MPWQYCALAFVFTLAACDCDEAGSEVEPTATGEAPVGTVVISVVGTNDLHGHIEWLPMFGGYVDRLREVREEGGGSVVLVDAGDMFQGTLESNLSEGAAVIRGYNALGYSAATIGNHEFDFGPTGPAATPQDEDDDRRGALLDRVNQASFPILSANLLYRETRERIDWPGVNARSIVEQAGIKIGIIGVTTEDTLGTTIAANVDDLAMAPLARTIQEQARVLREQDGVHVVIVTAHAGGKCRQVNNADDLSSCDPTEEIFQVADALPEGTVDVIVAGHTHQQVAHRVNGIPIIESHCYGVAFGRVDLTITDGQVAESQVFPTQRLCARHSEDPALCVPHPYEGGTVEADAGLSELLTSDFSAAADMRVRELSVIAAERFPKERGEESALGNLLADLIREARDGDVGLMNGGGIRSALGPGNITYGDFHEVFPFDNRFAVVEMSGREVAQLLANNLRQSAGILSVSGVTAAARCDRGRVVVHLRRTNGRPIADDETLRVVTSDYVATGSSAVFTRAREEGRVTIEDGAPMRDALSGLLKNHRSPLTPGRYFDDSSPRFSYSARPLRCD